MLPGPPQSVGGVGAKWLVHQSRPSSSSCCGGRHRHPSWARFETRDIGKINSRTEKLRSLDGNDSVLDGILNEFGVGLDL